MSRLENQVKKFLGVKPYDGSTNFVRYDNYFYAAMCKEFGEDAVKAEIKKWEF